MSESSQHQTPVSTSSTEELQQRLQLISAQPKVDEGRDKQIKTIENELALRTASVFAVVHDDYCRRTFLIGVSETSRAWTFGVQIMLQNGKIQATVVPFKGQEFRFICYFTVGQEFSFQVDDDFDNEWAPTFTVRSFKTRAEAEDCMATLEASKPSH